MKEEEEEEERNEKQEEARDNWHPCPPLLARVHVSCLRRAANKHSQDPVACPYHPPGALGVSGVGTRSPCRRILPRIYCYMLSLLLFPAAPTLPPISCPVCAGWLTGWLDV